MPGFSLFIAVLLFPDIRTLYCVKVVEVAADRCRSPLSMIL